MIYSFCVMSITVEEKIRRTGRNNKVKNLRQAKGIVIGMFVGVVFLAQMIAWIMINQMGAFEQPVWSITGTAALMTAITCSLYLLLRKLCQRFQGKDEATNDETTMVEDIYEIFRANR